MRIAIVSTPWHEVPPDGYGGIEAVCAALIDGLVARDHEVMMVSVGAHRTRFGSFAATYDEPQAHRGGRVMPELVHAAAAARILRDFDPRLVHDHSLAGPLLASSRPAPTVVTAHGVIAGDLRRFYGDLAEHLTLVAISESQRRAAPELPWAATVPNGIAVEDYPFRADKEDFLLFLGRIVPAKGPLEAIQAARAADRSLVLAAKCDEPGERAYFEQVVRPHLGPGVEWLGEPDEAEKKDLLARASCLLFPVQWDEPFGLVMVEAMACGTPVVGLRRGAVPEVVRDGVTGIVMRPPRRAARSGRPGERAAVGRVPPARSGALRRGPDGLWVRAPIPRAHRVVDSCIMHK